MWLLFSLLAAVALAKNETIYLVLKGHHGDTCKYWKMQEKKPNLWVNNIMFLMTEKSMPKKIDKTWISGDAGGSKYRLPIPKDGWLYEIKGAGVTCEEIHKKYDMKLAFYVSTEVSETDYGFENPIYYGYDKAYAGLVKGTTPMNQMKDAPFRFAEIVLTCLPEKNSNKKVEVIKIGKKAVNCSDGDAKGWIANHGIYLLQENSATKLPTFKNLYYWPRTGRILT